MILNGTFESSSSSAIYKTQYDTETGKGTCNCPGWTKRAVRECKHTKLLASDDRNGGASGFVAKVAKRLDAALVAAGPSIKPMLASAMKEGQSLADFMTDEWVMEEKYDGHRLLVYVSTDSCVTAWTRPGHDRPAALRALPPALSNELGKLPPGVYDGELLIPGGTSSDVVRLDLQDRLVFVLFDMPVSGVTSTASLPLWQRRELLEVAAAHVDNKALVAVAPQVAVSLATVRTIWSNGGEGAVIKRKTSIYRSGWRTPDWIKVKQIDAAELTITGFEEGKNGPCSVFKLRHDDGRETTCKVLTNELLRAVHRDPQSYIGRRITISYMGQTKGGLWRHPVFDHFVS